MTDTTACIRVHSFITSITIILYATLSHKTILRRIHCYYLAEVMNVKPLKVKVSMTLDSDIVEKLKELAEKDDRSFSQYVNVLLRRHLENYEDSSKGIL